MKQKINAVRGMNDIFEEKSIAFDFIIQNAKKVMQQYSYNSIHLPIVEKTALFSRAIGKVTDIVAKEMYTFEDRNADYLTLRPEGTAGCVRAMVENGWLHNQVRKVYYCGAMFRYERPQKGRYRQFHQFGVEVFGHSGSDIDAEIIMMSARLWKLLSIDNLQLQINTLGSYETRQTYREKLVAYLQDYKSILDEDSLKRLNTNPLRILDTKNPELKGIISEAPKLLDCLDSDSAKKFEQLQTYLSAKGINYEINPNLVRGLDYYNQTVFEWVTDDLGAQGTVCAGGRYDGLVEQIGGKPTPAVGFALGIERLMSLIIDKKILDKSTQVDVYIVLAGEKEIYSGLMLAEQIRDINSNLKVYVNTTGGSFKSQFKKADKSGASYAVVIGEQELINKTVMLKDLRNKDVPQKEITWDNLAIFLT